MTHNISKNNHWIVKGLVVTSKSTEGTEKNNTHTFVVHEKATKDEIRRVLKDELGLDVLNIRTHSLPKKVKNRGGKNKISRKEKKYAIVTFSKETVEKLDLYSTNIK